MYMKKGIVGQKSLEKVIRLDTTHIQFIGNIILNRDMKI